MALLNRSERNTMLALSGGHEMTLRIVVTDEERALIVEAAKAEGVRPSKWAEYLLVDEARRAVDP